MQEVVMMTTTMIVSAAVDQSMEPLPMHLLLTATMTLTNVYHRHSIRTKVTMQLHQCTLLLFYGQRTAKKKKKRRCSHFHCR
jgi:hypothetical protein